MKSMAKRLLEHLGKIHESEGNADLDALYADYKDSLAEYKKAKEIERKADDWLLKLSKRLARKKINGKEREENPEYKDAYGSWKSASKEVTRLSKIARAMWKKYEDAGGEKRNYTW